jgi:NitT/TauT family transport system permease protein
MTGGAVPKDPGATGAEGATGAASAAGGRLTGGRLTAVLPPLVVLLAVLLLWEGAVYLWQPPVFLLPAPHQIWAAFTGNFGNLFAYGFNTFLEALGGFAIGCTLGLLAAMVVARSPLLSDLLLPLAVASNSIPIVAMAPIALVWFGIGPASKIAIVAVMCFFPTLVSGVRGLRSAAPDAVALLRSYAASEWQVFRLLRMPAALPYLFNAFKICTALSMIGAIVAEFFGGGLNYLGVYIKAEASILHTPNAWAAILVACGFGLAFYGAVVLIERFAMPWRHGDK